MFLEWKVLANWEKRDGDWRGWFINILSNFLIPHLVYDIFSHYCLPKDEKLKIRNHEMHENLMHATYPLVTKFTTMIIHPHPCQCYIGVARRFWRVRVVILVFTWSNLFQQTHKVSALACTSASLWRTSLYLHNR